MQRRPITPSLRRRNPIGAQVASIAWVSIGTFGCAFAAGGSAGVTLDTGGNFGVLARAHTRAGGRNTDDDREVAVFWLPQMSLGGGWDLSRGGPRFEFGIPFLGFARLPHGSGTVYGMQTHFRAELAWPSNGPMRHELGPTLSFSYGRIWDYERVPKMYPDWPDGWIYHTAGWTTEAGLRFVGSDEDETTEASGAFFMGPTYEYYRFYYMGLGATENEDSPE